MDLDGLVVIAVAGLWIAYLVPHHLRHRQQLLEARADDRFSEHLRVLRVAEAVRVPTAEDRSLAGSPERVLLHPRRGGDGPMHRPHGAADRASADTARRTAAARAAHAAALARRAAAARRRAVLAAALLLMSVAGWGAVALAGAGLVIGALPSVLLVSVLGLGRRAVRAGARADAAWAAGEVTATPPKAADHPRTAARPGSARRVAPSVVGRAVHPSEAVTEVIVPEGGQLPSRRTASGEVPAASSTPPRVPVAASTPSLRIDVSGEGIAEQVSEQDAPDPMVDSGVGTWVPVPVPPPAYTLKPSARRAEPAPLPAQVSAPASSGATPAGEVDEPRPTTGGLPLDAILARRRAAGE
ncbi:hypothetical protein [Actinotalea sp.]|uniref:hypothetical protein n=1 Tax=Actinotalea sp. TaxID=1872145 RepID=UPI0035612CA3